MLSSAKKDTVKSIDSMLDAMDKLFEMQLIYLPSEFKNNKIVCKKVINEFNKVFQATIELSYCEYLWKYDISFDIIKACKKEVTASKDEFEAAQAIMVMVENALPIVKSDLLEFRKHVVRTMDYFL